MYRFSEIKVIKFFIGLHPPFLFETMPDVVIFNFESVHCKAFKCWILQMEAVKLFLSHVH